MSAFTLYLLAADCSERLEGIRSLVGQDASGSFGLLSQHERFITMLEFGLIRVQYEAGALEYLGLPGGLLYFTHNECRISTRRYLRDANAMRLAQTLSRTLWEEEQALKVQRHKLYQLENEMLRRLIAHGRE